LSGTRVRLAALAPRRYYPPMPATIDSTIAPPPAPRELWSHEFLDALALAYYCAMADKIEVNPQLVERARDNLQRWIADGGYAECQVRALLEWQPLLAPMRLKELVAVMRDPGLDATRMRQSGPFAGVLSAPERKAIKEQLKLDWRQNG
jgi:hypothetical protein